MKPLVLCIGLLTAINVSAQESPGKSEDYFPQQLSAKDLLYACASSALTSRGRERRRYCSGFISGVEEALRLLAQQSTSAEIEKPCLTKGMTARQYTDIYAKYAHQKSIDLDRPAALVVIEALQAAFPCKN